MGIKQIPLKTFKKFLKQQGLKHIRNNRGHEIWDYPEKPLPRPITFQGRYKEIPLTSYPYKFTHFRNKSRRICKVDEWLA